MATLTNKFNLIKVRYCLWPPCVADADIILLLCGLFFLLSSIFIPRLISAAADWIFTVKYFHTWCGLSANLGCRSEKCCTRLAVNTGCKKSPKIRNLHAHHRATLSGYIFATKARIDIDRQSEKTC